MLAGAFENPALVALMAGVPGLAMAYWAYRHSVREDEIAEQAAIATVESGSIAQAFGGLNQLNTALQVELGRKDTELERKDADNAFLQKDREDCLKQLADLSNRLPRTP